MIRERRNTRLAFPIAIDFLFEQLEPDTDSVGTGAANVKIGTIRFPREGGNRQRSACERAASAHRIEKHRPELSPAESREQAAAPHDSYTRLDGIDALRGLAATGVLLFHTIALLKLTVTAFTAPILNFFGLGVPLFFVLSSFIMFHHYGNATDSPAFARNFLIKRYARLFPVYALAFTVWHLALWWIHGQAYSTTPAEAIVNISLLFALTPTLSAGPTPASWSIGVEMLFYIAFIALARLSKRLPFLIGLLCLCYAISFQFSSGLVGKELPNQWYHAINPVLYLPCFIWGPIILCATKIKRVEGRAFALLAAAAALAFMVMLGWLAQIKDDVFGREPPLQYWVRVQLITLAFLPVIFVSACAPSVLIVNKVTVYLGRISYSLYLLHPIIIYFLGTRLLEVDLPGMAEPNLRFLVLAGILLAFTIVCAELSYRMIEMPGIALGRRLLGALNARGNSVPSNDRNELIPFHFPGTNERPKSI